MFAFGIGLASFGSSSGGILDVYYPTPAKNLDAQLSKLLTSWTPADNALKPEQAARLADALLDAGHERLGLTAQVLAEADRPLCWIELDEDRPIETTAEAYLKLHLLSHRFALPNSLNLDGIFAALPNVAWTSQGPIGIEDIDERVVRARLEDAPITLHALDKFPRMTDYVIPSGVRIAEREFKGEMYACDMDDNTMILLDYGDSFFAFVYGTAAGAITRGFAPSFFGTDPPAIITVEAV